MGWSIGWDSRYHRDIGYGVPAYCDHPDCNAEIDRGLAYVCCKEEPQGGDEGCGLYFCYEHRNWESKCERCALLPSPEDDDNENGGVDDEETEATLDEALEKWPGPFDPKPDHPTWLRHKLRDASWAEWRKENPKDVKAIRTALRAIAEVAVPAVEKSPTEHP